MSEQAFENPSIMSHVSLGTNQLNKALAFYDKVLATVGAKRILDVPNVGVGYGKLYPEFWVQIPFDEKVANVGNGVHFSFFGTSETMVKEFYKVALECGGSCDGEPGPRPHYGPEYYGCFVRDLDGNKIECTFWDESKTGA